MGTRTYSTFDLKAHLAEEHGRSPFSTYLKEIVFGGTDGIVTTFAVVAGFSGAQATIGGSPIPLFIVLLFGFANLTADAASMGIGNFLSVRANQDLYRKEADKERHEVDNHSEMEQAETVVILTKKGFNKQDAQTITNLYAKNKPYWVEFMMRDELNIQNPLSDNPFFTGLATTIAFMFFGLIPLIPYIITPGTRDLFQLSTIFTGTSLLLLGLLRYKVTRHSLARGVGETVLLGGLSATIAYIVGTFFRL